MALGRSLGERLILFSSFTYALLLQLLDRRLARTKYHPLRPSSLLAFCNPLRIVVAWAGMLRVLGYCVVKWRSLRECSFVSRVGVAWSARSHESFGIEHFRYWR